MITAVSLLSAFWMTGYGYSCSIATLKSTSRALLVARRHLLPILPLIAFFFVHAFCTSARCQTESDNVSKSIKDKWAVVVGISKFADPELNLKYAAKDATDFRNFLVKKCNFAPDHIKLITDEQATRNRILDVVGDGWLPHVALPDDLVVIFLSSHGSPSDLDVAGVNYFVAHDTNPRKLFTTGISLQELSKMIKERVHSQRALIILDACHSGAAGDQKGLRRAAGVDAAQIAQGTGHMVICSSAKNESSWESKKWPNGVFTHVLIDALQSKGEMTTVTQAFAYLKDGVMKEVVAERGRVQTPTMASSKWKGSDLILALKPTHPRKPPLLADVEAGSGNSSIAYNVAKVPSTPPDLKGYWVSNTGTEYFYHQDNWTCSWDNQVARLVGKGTISKDGKTFAASWSSPQGPGTGMGIIEVDAQNRGVKIAWDNGEVFTRTAQGDMRTRIPDLSGAWISSQGRHYQLTQVQNKFTWSIPVDNEEGLGIILPGGNTAMASWRGRFANTATFVIQCDSNNRAVRMISSDGTVFQRVGGQ